MRLEAGSVVEVEDSDGRFLVAEIFERGTSTDESESSDIGLGGGAEEELVRLRRSASSRLNSLSGRALMPRIRSIFFALRFL